MMDGPSPAARESPGREDRFPAGPALLALIPDLACRAQDYRVDTAEVDDELVALFVAEIEKVIPELTLAATRRDEAAVRARAHSLQGMGGTIGAPAISVVGVELSAAAVRGDFERCARLAAAVADWMAHLAGAKSQRGDE